MMTREMMALEHEAGKMAAGRRIFTFPMNADVMEDDGGTTILVDMPGFKKEDVTVNLTGRRIVICGERKADDENAHYSVRERIAGSFQRNFVIGYDADKADISAKLEDGVLTVFIPKKDAENGSIAIS